MKLSELKIKTPSELLELAQSLGIENISKNITDSISILVEKKLDLFSSAVNNK